MIYALLTYLLLALVTAFFISLSGAFRYEDYNKPWAIAFWPITWIIALFMLVMALGDFLAGRFDRWIYRKFGGEA